ncbi:hypothetical protein KN815_15105 [Streptomyces sp. 4503]|uniref:Uncharacterized protein n=1 Tax=Streptomyces niphimycinicus TaxID=2842201 RepID=A0ABS6CEQ0_9ACTN|nr:hypothetical protein [Streptomyces niphimycinicus]MBU3865349.1 hypothetical protein [Streptomyces niphimycinicus]
MSGEHPQQDLSDWPGQRRAIRRENHLEGVRGRFAAILGIMMARASTGSTADNLGVDPVLPHAGASAAASAGVRRGNAAAVGGLGAEAQTAHPGTDTAGLEVVIMAVFITVRVAIRLVPVHPLLRLSVRR